MSTLQTKTVRLGDSATLANNFELVVPPVPDGTLTLQRQSGTDILTVDAAGKVTVVGNFTANANKIAFSASSNLQTIPGDSSEFVFSAAWASETDPSNSFNLANGRFQPTVSGAYHIDLAVSYLFSGNNGSSTVVGSIRFNGLRLIDGAQATLGGLQFPIITVSGIVLMNGTTDYVDFSTLQNSGSASGNVRAQASGHLIYAN